MTRQNPTPRPAHDQSPFFADDEAIRGQDGDHTQQQTREPTQLDLDFIAANQRVLIVEDNAATGKMLALHRERFGSAAGRGADGLRLLQNESFDLVLLDLHMPGPGGLDILRALRENPPCGDPLPVVMTGYLDPQKAQTCRDLGVAQVLEKPFSASALVSRLSATLQEHIAIDRP